MRLALVVTGGVDRSGRIRVIPALLWLIERLAARHSVAIYALRYLTRPDTYPLLGATVRDLGSPAGIGRQYRALVGALRADGPFDVLHGYWGLPAGLVTAVAGRRLGVPSVVTLDSGELVAIDDIPVGDINDLDRIRPRFAYGLQRTWRSRLGVHIALRLATRVTVCTRFMHRLAQRHGIDPRVIPLGVDARCFLAAAGAAGPPWRLLHVASLNPVKDQSTLIKAAARLTARGVDLHLDIAGEDTLHGRIQELVRHANLGGRVTFHGFQPTTALAALYARAHLLVLSSRHEAAGVAVLEAAASGVPTVGTSVGYISDWAPDRAVAVPPNDPQALADAVEALLSAPERRTAIAHRARAWALEHDADWTATAFERLYVELT
jgi:glycosyltransferase involved in cell wall biosynthesis